MKLWCCSSKCHCCFLVINVFCVICRWSILYLFLIIVVFRRWCKEIETLDIEQKFCLLFLDLLPITQVTEYTIKLLTTMINICNNKPFLLQESFLPMSHTRLSLLVFQHFKFQPVNIWIGIVSDSYKTAFFKRYFNRSTCWNFSDMIPAQNINMFSNEIILNFPRDILWFHTNGALP